MAIHPRFPALVRQALQLQPIPKTVHLAVGELVLSREHAQAQWRQLVENTPLAASLLEIRIVPAEQQCMVCFLKYHPGGNETACPQCSSVGAKILRGEEFYLELD